MNRNFNRDDYSNLEFPPIIGQNWTYGTGIPNQTANPSRLAGLKGWFANAGKNSGWNLTGNSKIGLGNTNGKAGLTIAGKNLAPMFNIANGAYQGIEGIKNLSDLQNARNSKEDILNDIRVASISNPMVSSYLSTEQQKLLNRVKRGDYNSDNFNLSGDSFLNGLKGAGTGALMGLAGGLPGIIIGALGGGANGIISSNTNEQARQNAELEDLYATLASAQEDYRRMRTPNYPGLGLQSRYTNQWR